MVKSYESLMGSIGRAMFYRPERQRVRELLSRDAQPRLLVNGHEFPLFDISMNGLSFLSPNDVDNWPIGKEIELALVLHDEEVYTGPARIARAEPGPRGARVGLGLTTGFLDLPMILRRDDEKRLERDLHEGPKSIQNRVPKRYRETMTKMVHFLGFYRRSLSGHERRYRAEGKGEEGCLELAERAYEAIVEPWWELQSAASRAAIDCLGDRDVLLAAKEYTETLVTPLVLDSPIGWRTYNKPLGYAGDFKTMLFYYHNAFEGDTAFGKVIHKFYVGRYPLGVGVRTRKNLMVEWMENEHRRALVENPDSASFRVVSLGCGPAREVSDFIARNRSWPGNVVWTLIDQEEEALSEAYRASRSEISKWGSNGHLNLLNLSFVQLLSEGVPLQEPGSQDFIYSVGFFDYVRESRGQTLIRALYDLLAKGGLLAIGNAIAPNELFWSTEFLVDWTLLFRTRDEMLKLGALLPDTAEVDVVKEPSGAYYFLLVRKH
jgi:SAM-dependent methyltransferase